MTDVIVLSFLFWIVWMIGYLVGINQTDKSLQKPVNPSAPATRRMVDAGVEAFKGYDGTNGMDINEYHRELVTKIYRVMKDLD